MESEMGREWNTDGGEEEAYRILVGKLEGKKPLSRPRRRWMDNVKMDLRDIGWGGSILLRIGASGRFF
jgi:hypothetical protein